MNSDDRFWNKVDKSGECWIWKGALDKYGYGDFRIKKRRVGAHRFSFFIANPDVPRSAHVLHSCDNPACVNPGHLSGGTHQQNMDDMKSKCRQLRGEQQVNAKLSDADVANIKRMISEGLTLIGIASVFRVDPSTISKIKRGKRWMHITEAA